MFRLTHSIQNTPTSPSTVAAASAASAAEDEAAVAARKEGGVGRDDGVGVPHSLSNISEEDDDDDNYDDDDDDDDDDGDNYDHDDDDDDDDDGMIRNDPRHYTKKRTKDDHYTKKMKTNNDDRHGLYDPHHQQQQQQRQKQQQEQRYDNDDDHHNIVVDIDTDGIDVDKEREKRLCYPCVAFSDETYRDDGKNNKNKSVPTYYRCFANCIGRDVFVYEYRIHPPYPISAGRGNTTKTTMMETHATTAAAAATGTTVTGQRYDEHNDVINDDKTFRRRQWYTSSRPNENFFACTFAMQSRRRRRTKSTTTTTTIGTATREEIISKEEGGEESDNTDNCYYYEEDQIFCVGGARRSILIIDVRTGNLIMELVGSSGEIYDLKASPKPPHDDRQKGQRHDNGPATTRYGQHDEGTDNNNNNTNNNNDHKERASSDEDTDAVIDYNHPSNSANLLCSASTSEIRIWNLDTYACVCIFGGDPGGHRGDVYTVAWHPTGHKIVSGGVDGTIRIWTIDGNTSESGRRIQEAIQASSNVTILDEGDNDDSINDISIDNSRSQFHSVCERFPWSVHTGIHEEDVVDCVEWVGNMILSKSCDGVIKLWMPTPPKDDDPNNSNRFVTPNDDDGDDDNDDDHKEAATNFILIKTFKYPDAGAIYYVRFALGGGRGGYGNGCFGESHDKNTTSSSSDSNELCPIVSNPDWSKMHLEGRQKKQRRQQQDQLNKCSTSHTGGGGLSGLTLAVGNRLGQVFLWNISMEEYDSVRPYQRLNAGTTSTKGGASNKNKTKKKTSASTSTSSSPALMRGLAFSPDGNTLVGCDDNYNVFRWDLRDTRR